MLDCELVVLLEQGGKACGSLLQVLISGFNQGSPKCKADIELANTEINFYINFALGLEHR
jgi:hypothetical protein